MNKQLVKGILVFGVSGLVFWLLRPSISKRKPVTTKEPNPQDQAKNAIIVANAYGKALQAGETPKSLEELNKMTEDKYGLRVDKKQADGKYYVMDTKGNTVLKIT
jgi:hypothetical protein